MRPIAHRERLVAILTAIALVVTASVTIHRPQRAAERAMRAALMQMVAGEERVFVDSGRYTAALAAVSSPGDSLFTRVRLSLHGAGWQATLSAMQDSTFRCAIGIDAPNPLDNRITDDAIACRRRPVK